MLHAQSYFLYMLKNVIISLPDNFNKSLIINVEIEHSNGTIQQQIQNRRREKHAVTRDALLYCYCILTLGN